MEGQEIEIRVITGEYLPLHRAWKYKYEVVSGQHEGRVDFAVSDTILR